MCGASEQAAQGLEGLVASLLAQAQEHELTRLRLGNNLRRKAAGENPLDGGKKTEGNLS